MSAKSGNFALEIVENMSEIKDLAKRMTHTCYRCRLSEFYNTSAKGLQLKCRGGRHVAAGINAETTCDRWSPSVAVSSLIDGTADIRTRKVVTEILNSRVADGTF